MAHPSGTPSSRTTTTTTANVETTSRLPMFIGARSRRAREDHAAPCCEVVVAETAPIVTDRTREWLDPQADRPSPSNYARAHRRTGFRLFLRIAMRPRG